jgi:hypothetical protein
MVEQVSPHDGAPTSASTTASNGPALTSNASGNSRHFQDTGRIIGDKQNLIAMSGIRLTDWDRLTWISAQERAVMNAVPTGTDRSDVRGVPPGTMTPDLTISSDNQTAVLSTRSMGAIGQGISILICVEAASFPL